ncbi:MAG: HNH endonuclease signature motif containing protein [Pseudomonadota bacterium]
MAAKIQILVRQAVCASCKGPLGDVFGLEFDHQIPLAMGGEDDIENLRALQAAARKAVGGE